MSESLGNVPNSCFWSPELPPYAFAVHMLAERPQSVPLEGLLVNSEGIYRELRDRLFTGDDIRLVDSSDTIGIDERVLEIDANVVISQQDFGHAAVQEALVWPKETFKPINRQEAEASGISGRFPGQEETAVLKGLYRVIDKEFRPDWTFLPEGLTERQHRLSQMIQFESGGKYVNLYNLTPTQLTEEQIGKIANALREISDRTGGAIFDMLEVMAIAPNDDPCLVETDNEGKLLVPSSSACSEGGFIVFGEGLFNPDAPHPIYEGNWPWEAMVTEQNPYLVPGDENQLTPYHELAHVVECWGEREDVSVLTEFKNIVGWRRSNRMSLATGLRTWVRGTVENPIIYGRLSPEEDMAVTAEAEFAGGPVWEQFDSARKQAITELWKRRRSKIEGPTFVTATELPLPGPSEKIGLPPQTPLAIWPWYAYRIVGAHDVDSRYS